MPSKQEPQRFECDCKHEGHYLECERLLPGVMSLAIGGFGETLRDRLYGAWNVLRNRTDPEVILAGDELLRFSVYVAQQTARGQGNDDLR